MSNLDLLPGINFFSIHNDDGNSNIELYKTKDNHIKFTFEVTGLTKLKNPITDYVNPFYLFTAITFQNSGRDYEIIALSDIFLDEEKLSQDSLKFIGQLNIPYSKVYKNDYVNTMYYFIIAHTYKEITSEDEMIRLLSPYDNLLFRTKLNVTIKELL